MIGVYYNNCVFYICKIRTMTTPFITIVHNKEDSYCKLLLYSDTKLVKIIQNY